MLGFFFVCLISSLSTWLLKVTVLCIQFSQTLITYPIIRACTTPLIPSFAFWISISVLPHLKKVRKSWNCDIFLLPISFFRLNILCSLRVCVCLMMPRVMLSMILNKITGLPSESKLRWTLHIQRYTRNILMAYTFQRKQRWSYI